MHEGIQPLDEIEEDIENNWNNFEFKKSFGDQGIDGFSMEANSQNVGFNIKQVERRFEGWEVDTVGTVNGFLIVSFRPE